MRHLRLAIVLISLLGLAFQPAAAPGPQAAKPFSLPFAEPPGPGTWLLTQTYGNTTGAYYWRRTVYGAGQGLHFGIDFAARCGTPIVALLGSSRLSHVIVQGEVETVALREALG